MPTNIKPITLEEFLSIREKLYDNAEDLCKREVGFHWNIITRGEWQYQNFNLLYLNNNESAAKVEFRDCYHFERTMIRWNDAIYGRDYELHLKRYKELSEDPASIERLKQMVVTVAYPFRRAWRNSREAVKSNTFLSFWKFHVAYRDTKGSWRHWWDALKYDKKFIVGDIVELRANAKFYHTLEVLTYEHIGCVLKRLDRTTFKACSKKAMMVIAYDQQVSSNTYSYKKSQGSCRLVSVLPMGSVKVLYVPEQFLKISRKKTIKDAKAKK